MIGRTSKQSEQAYGRTASAAAWERLKPFSPPGANTLAESLPLIHDFAIAANILGAAPEHLILDLGAGACWCSEWLQRLNLRTVSVDISLDMLKVGRRRLLGSGAARVAAGDLERLPFASASFDRVVCLNALHHVPSAEAALREVSRVLRPAGLAVFSEPGMGHSENPLSAAAMRDFGVLEQDIRISDFLRACHSAGFADVRIKPLSYMVPLDLTSADWNAWQALARRRRPRRALQKIGRGVLEIFGLGKRGTLFEEAVTMNVVRVLKGAIEDHPILVAYKERALSVTAIFAAAIALVDPPARVRRRGRMSFHVAVTNTGNQIWHATPAGANYVRLGVQLLDRDMKLVDRDYHRESLTATLAPGRRSLIAVDCPAPGEADSYGFKIDLVRESLAWFETLGSKAPIWRFDVVK